MSLWWISVCDPTAPAGRTYVGAVVIQAESERMAKFAALAWIQGILSAAVLEAYELPPSSLPPPRWRNRLLTGDEADEAERWCERALQD